LKIKLRTSEALFKQGHIYDTHGTTQHRGQHLLQMKSKADFPADKKGLNELGRSIVRRMNELGMLVDLSHVGERGTMRSALYNKPVLVSHSCVYSFVCPVPRNLKDDARLGDSENGGVIP